MDIMTLCSEVQERRAHLAFLEQCEEEYQQEMQDSQSEEDEEDEEEDLCVQALNVRWFDVFTGNMPRESNAFHPIDVDDFAMLSIRQALHRCVQERVTSSQAHDILIHTWQTCEEEKSKEYLQGYRYKRIMWASIWALDLIFVFK
jgi:hypothetical protein